MDVKRPLIEVAMAILHRDGQFLMQLRDDFPHIVHPGIWGFFGGHLDPGEDADTGIKRELIEELAYLPSELSLLEKQTEGSKRRYYYYGELSVPVSELALNEGQDLALCSVDEIRTGQKYSRKLGEVRSLGKPHQKVLLRLINQRFCEA